MSKDRKERLRRGKEEEEVDATGVTSMLLLLGLRVPGDGGKSLGNAAKSRQTAPITGANRANGGCLETSLRIGALYK